MTYFNNYSTEFIRVTGEVCGSARGIEAEQLFLHWQGLMTAGGTWRSGPTTATMNESPSFNFVGPFGVEEQWTYLLLLWVMVCTWVSTACAPAWHVAFALAASTGVAAEIVWHALVNLCPCSSMLNSAESYEQGLESTQFNLIESCRPAIQHSERHSEVMICR